MHVSNIFAVYKPVEMTSHDVVNAVRRKTGVKRVGHGGTLDPLAEGVLVIAVGRENTKKLDQYVKGEKEYLATLKLGFVSETDDAEGPIHVYKSKLQDSSHSSNINIPNIRTIRVCIKKFTGQISQTPPLYSAIKVRGKPSHRRIRKGEKFELESRMVEIKSIKVISYEYPILELKIECGSGVYIRSLARDLGRELDTGAYLTKLIRTKVGEFSIDDVVVLEKLVARG